MTDMNGKIANFKFYLLTAWLIPEFALSIPLTCLTYGTARVIGIILIIFGIGYGTAVLLTEPLCYIISGSGVLIRLAFSGRYYLWEEIISIDEEYDCRFDFLLVRNYVIHTKNSLKKPARNEKIVKCRKSTELIKKYFEQPFG